MDVDAETISITAHELIGTAANVEQPPPHVRENRLDTPVLEQQTESVVIHLRDLLRGRLWEPKREEYTAARPGFNVVIG
jgi:hypothetical protein